MDRIYNDKMYDAIIIDLDSTLVNNDHRQHYIIDFFDDNLSNKILKDKEKDWISFNAEIPNDTINNWCDEIINNFTLRDYIVFIVTERYENVRTSTTEWLNKHAVYFDEIFMRPINDYRQSAVYKSDVVKKHIIGKYNIVFAIDDEPSVVKMYHELGITSLQVIK